MKSLGSYKNKTKSTAGFTLVELLVTITIFVVLTGVVLWNQSKFNSTILFTNLAYDVALTVRQAQNFGLNIKGFSDTLGKNSFLPYGVVFDKTNSPKSFLLFADINFSLATDPNKLTTFGGDINNCLTNQGCVNRYNITRGNYIKMICEGSYDKTNQVCGGIVHDRLDIIFLRPNPDAHLFFDRSVNESDKGEATIVLSSADNSNTRLVHLRSNGLIEVSQ